MLLCLGLGAQEKRLVGINGAVYSLNPDEADAIEFLYKSMPLSDRLMHDADYYIRNVRTTLKARDEMPWGKQVPEHIWRHFVLPVRANNENTDNFRTSYYDELKRRVQGMNMHDAALEVNHWLHEKVTYEPSDARTSAPTATIRTAKGRCGEESVLAVAAYRAVGIPARQVYTPRWAHTDDNHAWVEIWVDGKWHFLGACEPEPELDRAWFNAPASRGMLMHTRVFGNYPGPEQIISVKEGITEINVTENYVPIRNSTVTVVDASGKPMPDIAVDFKIYNYAEFYTAAVITTDANGKAMLKTGKGNMLAWASKGDMFGFALIDSENTRLVLNHKIGECFSVDMDIVPPAENPIPSKVTEAQIAENKVRTDKEDRIRAAYEDGFFGRKYCNRSVRDLQNNFLPEYASEAEFYLEKARGNWQAIYDFLINTPEERLEDAFDLLDVISDKDLRDVPARVLINTLKFTPSQPDNELFAEYILNPRVYNELLTDYRMTLRFPGSDKLTPEQAMDYIAKNVTINDKANAYRVPITPTQVWKGREADRHSRDIFFVALMRNAGRAARINPVNGLCQYHDGNDWVTVDFEKRNTEVKPQGRLTATYEPTQYLANPEYYRHFSISQLTSGKPRLMEFGDDMGETYNSLLKDGVDLPVGYYMLTSGVRQANGSVSAHLEFFNIEQGKTQSVPLKLRHEQGAVEVIGSINPEQIYQPADGSAKRSILSTTGRGYFILALLGDTDEPSNHAAQELEALIPTLKQWQRPVMLFGRDRKEFNNIPNFHRGTDSDGAILKMMQEAVPALATEDSNARLPIIMVADSFGRVVFISQGYDTSLAQKITSIIPAL